MPKPTSLRILAVACWINPASALHSGVIMKKSKAKPTKKAPAQKRPKIEPYIYLGQRLSQYGGRVQQIFNNAKGTDEIVFRSVKGIYPGGVYEFDVANGVMKTRPERIWDSKITLTEAQEREFEAHKIVIKGWREERKKAMQINQPHANISQAIRLLKPFMKRLSYTDRRRFMEYIHNEASKK